MLRLFALLALLFVTPALAQDPPEGPYNLSSYRGRVGVELQFTVIGSATGGIWGNGIYSDDSSLAVAAVHAGLLTVGEKGVVTVRLLGPQTSFTGTQKNGITSGNYGAWDGSYEFVGAATVLSTPSRSTAGAIPDPGTLTGYSSQVGDVLKFEVTGKTLGYVYGSGPYTTDSSLAVAAVHAGLLQVGQTGVVMVEILGPQDSFAASDRNGVSTMSWTSYPSAFQFITEDKPQPTEPPDVPTTEKRRDKTAKN